MRPFGEKKKIFAEYTINEQTLCPKQVGGADCGIYTTKHMQHYGLEWWHEVTMSYVSVLILAWLYQN